MLFLPASPSLTSTEMTGLGSLMHFQSITIHCQMGSLVPLSSFCSITTQGQPSMTSGSLLTSATTSMNVGRLSFFQFRSTGGPLPSLCTHGGPDTPSSKPRSASVAQATFQVARVTASQRGVDVPRLGQKPGPLFCIR